MKISLVAALAIFAIALPASASAGRPAPGAFVAQVYQWALNGEGDRLYNALVPQQRRLVKRDVMDTCASHIAAKQTSAVTIMSWKTLDSLPVKVTIPGTTVRVKTLAVTVRLKASDGSSGVDTAHVVATSTGWEWMIDAPTLAKYRAGRCPS